MSKNSRIKSILIKQAKENTPDVWEQIDRQLEGRPVPQAEPQKPIRSFKLRYAAAGVAFVLVAAVSVTLWKLAPLPNIETSSSLPSAAGSQAVSSQPSANAAASSFDSSPVPYSSLRFASSPGTASSLGNVQGYGAATIAAFTEKLVLSDSDLICKATILNTYEKEYKYDTYSDKFESHGIIKDRTSSIVYEIKIDEIYYNNTKMHAGDIIKVENELLGEDLMYTLKQNHQYILPLYKGGENIIYDTTDYASGDIKRDGRYGICYPFAPQIEITLDNQYVFHGEWKSLLNDKTVDVIWKNDIGHFDFYADKMKLRQDTDFINDFKALIAKYKS